MGPGGQDALGVPLTTLNGPGLAPLRSSSAQLRIDIVLSCAPLENLASLMKLGRVWLGRLQFLMGDSSVPSRGRDAEWISKRELIHLPVGEPFPY